ncbi:MAG: hypothetical protein K2N92_01240, partial [Malacoplasma sp.]|nr:hypothetical protein [Malacoplasma sp.]
VEKRANLNKIYEKIKKKYSLREFTIYAFVGYYKHKRNTLLVCFSNQKIFIGDEKDKVSFCGVYTYKDIRSLNFVPNDKNHFNSYIEIETENYKIFKIKGVGKEEFRKIKEIFKNQKEIYMKAFLEKVTTEEKKYDLVDENFSYSSVSSMIKKDEEKMMNENFIEFDKNQELKQKFTEEEIVEKPENLTKNENKYSGSTFYESLIQEEEITSDDLVSQSNLLVESIESSKNKKVVNDSLITNTNSFSSSFLANLLTNEETLLPGGKRTIFSEILKKIKELESKSLSINGIDTTPITLQKKVLKLNTVPVIVETKSINNVSNSDDDLENRLIFSRNWIEYTKHNVVDKVLGVDANGNGAYIDISKVGSSSSIDIFKAKEYKINDEVRSGLRSSQTISFLEKNGRPGLDFFYNNLKTNEKLNVFKYDGILFMGIKYYFNVYNEFSKLQKKSIRIFVEDKKINGEVFRKYELIFDDDLLTYKAYNERSQLIDDSSPNSSSYDLKWLMFFKE